MQVIQASRDLGALAKALPGFIEYAATAAESDMVRNRRKIRKATAVNPERFERDAAGPEIGLAFEMWIGHLAWLDHVSHAVEWRAGDLDSDEAEGLALYRGAREKFWSEHMSCSVCQSVNLRDSKFCGGCGKDFGG